MQVLLIEDNQHIGSNIKQFLEIEGCHVDRQEDGVQGLQQALTHTYDIVILDRMLPGLDGFSLLQEVRERKHTPVIMTTAKGALDDKSQVFGAGADDYLVKPFALEELRMRMQAVTKRATPNDTFYRRDIEVVLDENIVRKAGKEIPLALKEFQLLAYLIDQEGRAVSRADLIEQMRGAEAVFEHDAKLDVYISNLRRKLDKELIVTIKGFGYKLAQT